MQDVVLGTDFYQPKNLKIPIDDGSPGLWLNINKDYLNTKNLNEALSYANSMGCNNTWKADITKVGDSDPAYIGLLNVLGAKLSKDIAILTVDLYSEPSGKRHIKESIPFKGWRFSETSDLYKKYYDKYDKQHDDEEYTYAKYAKYNVAARLKKRIPEKHKEYELYIICAENFQDPKETHETCHTISVFVNNVNNMIIGCEPLYGLERNGHKYTFPHVLKEAFSEKYGKKYEAIEIEKPLEELNDSHCNYVPFYFAKKMLKNQMKTISRKDLIESFKEDANTMVKEIIEWAKK